MSLPGAGAEPPQPQVLRCQGVLGCSIGAKSEKKAAAEAAKQAATAADEAAAEAAKQAATAA